MAEPGAALTMPDESTVHREVVVAPSMCGTSSLIFGRIGDWTWEAVEAACRTDVHRARTAEGQPMYLSFYYFSVRGSAQVHPHGLQFGDRLEVTSRVFDFGSSSTLALHRIAPENSSQAGTALDAEEFYDHPDPGCLYVENMNRWVSRTLPGSNNTLAALAPDGFTHSHLPRVPNRYSVRTPVGRAREAASFMPDACADLALQDGQFCFDYQLDLVRDINGAGLIYFAAYFAIFDTALLQWWRSLGRADAQFSRRRVVQQRVGFFGNADPGAKCVITVQNWVNPTGGQEVADMAMHDASTGRLLAVTAIELGGR